MSDLFKVSRRDFLKAGGVVGGGLVIGFNLYSCKGKGVVEPHAGFDEKEINAYITINGDGTATLLAKNPEIGQGVRTSLPMILAEELDIPWEKVEVRQAKLDARLGKQFAGGSTSVTNNYENLRKAGAAVREVLVSAAAKGWQVPLEECKTNNGYVIHGEKKIHYGMIALAASELELPEEPKLKQSKDFKVIGKPTQDVDLKKIVTGKPLFGLDQEMEGMVYATVVKPDVFGAKVISFDASEAKQMAGVIDVIKVERRERKTELMDGVAVVANTVWAAFKAKKMVQVEWGKPDGYTVSMKSLHEGLVQGVGRKGEVLREDGDVEKVFKQEGAILMEAAYEVPFVSHSQMEPMNFIADVKENEVHLLGPTQTPGSARKLASTITGIDKENITVGFTRIGGGFGRRLANDYAAEAVFISQKIKKPVKLVWNRENDFLGDLYRPAGCYRFKASLEGTKITGFEANICTTSRKMYAGANKNLHGTEAFPDQQPAGMVPNFKVTYEPLATNVPQGALRTPGVNATTFAYQCFIDELAEKAGMDPMDFQIKMIGKDRDIPYSDHGGPTYHTGKLKNVIRLVREKSGWDHPVPEGISRGFAGQMVFGTYVAQVVEVSMKNGKVKIHKVTCAVDCGKVINPLGADAQVQGGITDAISAALYEEINLADGKLMDQNFDRYLKLRMKDSPEVEVHFVKSDEHPQGLGEPSYPVLFPALCNAVYAATGTRVRSLPLRKHGLV